MRPRPAEESPFGNDLFGRRLDPFIYPDHELVRLAGLIDWEAFDETFEPLYDPGGGRPAKPTRLMVGLLLLKHIKGLSDEQAVAGWVESPYWQFFCGGEFFERDPPIDPSSLTRFRKRIGAAGCERILKESVEAGVRGGAVKRSDFKRVSVDTTVQEKAVAFPTDARLLNRSRERLVKLCRKQGVALRQSYARNGPKAAMMAGRYAHARQMKRMRREVRKLRTWLGRVVRDIERKTAGDASLRAAFEGELAKARRLIGQKRADSNKLYSLHAPEVECIAKGKARQRYEFGVKAGIAVTNRSSFIVGGMALPGNPYDGHTLKTALEQVARLTGSPVEEAFVDRGYRGHKVEGTKVFISGQRRGVDTPRLKRSLKRRQAVEPVIGHLKSDGLMDRNRLKGPEGDAANVLLACAGHNLRLVLRRIRRFCARIQGRILRALFGKWLRTAARLRIRSPIPA